MPLTVISPWCIRRVASDRVRSVLLQINLSRRISNYGTDSSASWLLDGLGVFSMSKAALRQAQGERICVWKVLKQAQSERVCVWRVLKQAQNERVCVWRALKQAQSERICVLGRVFNVLCQLD